MEGSAWLFGVIIGAYVFYRLFFSPINKEISDIDKSLNDVITSEKYKVKGQYDEK